MGSPDISVPFLDFLHEKSCELAVFTQKDKVRSRGKKTFPTAVSKRAEQLGLPVYKLSVKSEEAFNIINSFKPDIFLVVAYGQIIPSQTLDIPGLYPLNVHFSLLPEYRGATPVNTALLEGKTVTGTTIMIMDKGLDTGNILLSEKCDIDPSDNATTLFQKLVSLSLNVLAENWTAICDGTLESKPQSGEISHTKLIKKNDLIIDFNRNSESVNNQIRAYNFEPGTKTFFRNKTLFIEQAENIPDINGHPGEILSVDKRSFTVACKEGAIKILSVKPESGKSMSSGAFINGHKPFPGEKLG
ncbi:MAG TPA: methionyl-tRNA formyltransferase [bacterium]|nr:methionyl-tRNA formyltransferase [bacterium]